MQSEVGRPASSRSPAPSTPRPPGLPVPPPKLSLSSFSQQIRKLRRELESSQEKVATLTSQLSANVSGARPGVGEVVLSIPGAWTPRDQTGLGPRPPGLESRLLLRTVLPPG